MNNLGKYEILAEIGRGGYGTVYRARDTVLDVERAVKVLHPALVADHAFIERFKREARFAARLKHAHIVPVYDLGESDGRYYLAMEFIPGGSLKDLLAKEIRLPFEVALEITRQIADALDYAHQQGLIHRDIKPGNILFEEQPLAGKKPFTRLADFGFAKALSGAGSASYSISGAMIGTPAYMAPEVWRGKESSPATDEYSLACVFYELITGVVLFDGESPPEIMTKHMLDGPRFPEKWPEGVPAGIGGILIQALDKDPGKRFATPGEFVTRIEHGAYSSKITSLMLEGREALAQKAWSRVEDLASRMEILGEEGRRSSTSLREYLSLARQEQGKRTRQEEEEALTRRKLEELARLEAKKKEQEIARYLSRSNQALDRGSWNQVEQIVARLGQLGEEGQAAAQDLQSHLDQARQEAGTRARVREQEKAGIEAEKKVREITRLLDAAQAGLDRESWSLVENIVETLGQMGENGQAAAVDVRERLKKARLDAEEYARLELVEKAHQEQEKKAREILQLLDEANVSLDGAGWKIVAGICARLDNMGEAGQAAAADVRERLKKARLDAEEYARLEAEEKIRLLKEKQAREISWLLDEAKAALDSGAWKKVQGICAQLEKLGQGGQGEARKLENLLVNARQEAQESLKSGGGKQGDLAPTTLLAKFKARLMQGRSGWVVFAGVAILLVLVLIIWLGSRVPSLAPIPTNSPMITTTRMAAQSPEFNQTPSPLVTANTLFGARLKLLSGHTGNVHALAFSSDGQTLASGAEDGSIRLWHVSDGTLLQTLEGNNNSILSVALSPNGQILASGSADGKVRLWQVASGSLSHTLEGHVGTILSVAFSPDGQILASASNSGSVRLWQGLNGVLLRILDGHPDAVNSVAFSPDGQVLVTGSSDNSVRIWRTSDGSLIKTLKGHIGAILSLAFSPDGQTLASGSMDSTVHLWRTSDGSPLRMIQGPQGGIISVAFLSAGQILAFASGNGTIQIWQVADATLMLSLEGYYDKAYSVAFSPDGSSLALGYLDNTIRLWSLNP